MCVCVPGVYGSLKHPTYCNQGSVFRLQAVIVFLLCGS